MIWTTHTGISYQHRNIYSILTTDAASSASYVGIHVQIDKDIRLRTKPYDKGDYCNFFIVNFPFICSNISQTMINKTLHRKLKIKQHEPTRNWGWTHMLLKSKQFKIITINPGFSWFVRIMIIPLVSSSFSYRRFVLYFVYYMNLLLHILHSCNNLYSTVNKRYFCIKTMLDSSLAQVACRSHVLFTLFVFACI
jgi:hypothetical protein